MGALGVSWGASWGGLEGLLGALGNSWEASRGHLGGEHASRAIRHKLTEMSTRAETLEGIGICPRPARNPRTTSGQLQMRKLTETSCELEARVLQNLRFTRVRIRIHAACATPGTAPQIYVVASPAPAWTSLGTPGCSRLKPTRNLTV